MKLIIQQLPVKAEWRNAHITPCDLAEKIYQNIIYKKQIFLKAYHQNLTYF